MTTRISRKGKRTATAPERRELFWIDVLDHMPDDEMNVLIAVTDGEGCEVWTGFHDGDDGWRYSSAEKVVGGIVTHWMDFPDPPIRKGAGK